MAQQKHIVDKLRASYPYVDLVFGVDGIDRLPAMLVERCTAASATWKPRSSATPSWRAAHPA